MSLPPQRIVVMLESILFVKTSRVHFDVFLFMRFVRSDIYMLARAKVAVVDILFAYQLALSMLGSLSSTYMYVLSSCW